MARFEGKTAFVTGSGSGIGNAITEALIAEGATVYGGDLKPGDAREGYVPITLNVTKEEDFVAAMAQIKEERGKLDIAFNVAGATKPGPIVALPEADWDFTVDLVLKGVFLATKHEASIMTEGGSIVIISSLNAHVPMWFGAAYASGKAGAEMFAKNAALELARQNIRVNAILPGLVATPLTSGFSQSPELSAEFNRVIALGRPADPTEIARPALFLSSDDASYITGASLMVDGGWELTGYPDLSKFMG